MELLCRVSCYFEGSVGDEVCFTEGEKYTVVSGDLDEMGEVELIDDQGAAHYVSGEWADRFTAVPTFTTDELQMFSNYIDSRKRARNLLWDEEKPQAEELTEVAPVQYNVTPAARWARRSTIVDDEF